MKCSRINSYILTKMVTTQVHACPARPGATFLEDVVVAANQVWAKGAT
ncbi:MAG: hypothetical protein ISS63_14950 [Desulfobacteraceae bacterium]|nr:hypothetical protein [Desulfobacteraceae bacterium]